MNLKMILATTLLVLIIVGLITYGYTVYAILADTVNKGDIVVANHQQIGRAHV